MGNEFLVGLLEEVEELPEPDAVLGLVEGGQALESLPDDLDSLLKDPDVQVIMEASDRLRPV